jgi:hypothetical protein
MTGAVLFAVAVAAQAAPLSDSLGQARAALASGDAATARSLLAEAETLAAQSPHPLPPASLGQLFYYRGLAAALEAGELEPAMDLWRAAFAVAPALSWESELRDERAWHATFEALRREVASRETRPLSVPDRRGAARLYVDGVPVDKLEGVREGLHLAQITCDDGTTRGAWFQAGRRVAWFRLCPGGIDRDAVAAAPGPDDDWSVMAPSFDQPEPAPQESSAAATGQGHLAPALLVSGAALLASSLALNLSTAAPPGTPAGRVLGQGPRVATVATGATGLVLLAGGLTAGSLTAGSPSGRSAAAPPLQLGWTWSR